ncbi:hypothetical protein Enr8_39900 [Blastopirellula retiformator]|uniref:Uncharacterized protein n=1 Tax=Blastopirellula retiformator TaxID=2527970 RepID=A0A5C5V096_9BACT|nr:hypothetical protein Enr8_39900 [Blastopirellula retiformator]
MTIQEFTQLENVLRERFATVDIRSDQCDTIRLISPSITAGCSYSDGHYHAKVISLELESDLDFETKLLATLDESTPGKLADSLAEFFGN